MTSPDGAAPSISESTLQQLIEREDVRAVQDWEQAKQKNPKEESPK